MGRCSMKPCTLAFLVALIAPFVAASSSAESGVEAWQPPRMSWGAPDLQGTWTIATITGLERPFLLRSPVLTPQEASGVENWTADFYAATRSLYRQNRVDAINNGVVEVEELPNF